LLEKLLPYRKFHVRITVSATAAFLALILALLPGIANSEHRIATWPGNKKGAVSLTFDDGCKSQYLLGFSELERRGYRGTFFLVSDYVFVWDHWKEAAQSGHEIGSHTKTHPHLTRLFEARMREEMEGSKAGIEGRIPLPGCVLFAYPFGDLNEAVRTNARNLYTASRGGGIACGLNDESVDFSNVKGCSPDDGNDIYGFTDAAEQQGKWLVAIFHSLDGGKECYGSWAFETWTKYLDYLKMKNLWVGPFGVAAKYARERMSAILTVNSSTEDRISLSLTDNLEDEIYDQPLSIISKVPAGWKTVIVQQGAKVIVIPSVQVGGERVVQYDAIPDRGTITLGNSNED
jgi:peptidoglycan/xylan/chitin deacetylase (PgdA/CDA1 family)